jgi:23S rRNA (guanosine2251-2'-O)-methyltransferase
MDRDPGSDRREGPDAGGPRPPWRSGPGRPAAGGGRPPFGAGRPIPRRQPPWSDEAPPWRRAPDQASDAEAAATPEDSGFAPGPRDIGRRPPDRPRPYEPRRGGPRPGGPGRPGFARPSQAREGFTGADDVRRPPARPLPPLGADEELVAGRRPVEEAFAAQRPALRLLVVPQRRQALERIVLHATTLRIPIVEVEGGSLTSLAGFDGHQGIALVVAPRRFASLDDILARAIQRGEPPLILVLDSLEDPQNVGTLLRSAEAAGAHGVVFPTERQAPLSPAAIKASAGATEHLLLAPVDDLPGALADLHVRGLRVLGSDADAPLTAREADLRGPVAIVVGSEGHGLSPAVRRRCDLFVRIPMRGAIGSLNAAVAGSVLLFEALGQRDPAAKPEPGPGAALRGNVRDREPDRLEAGFESDRPGPVPAVVAAGDLPEAPPADDVAPAAPPAGDVAPAAPPTKRSRARKLEAAPEAASTMEAPNAPSAPSAPSAPEAPPAEPPVSPSVAPPKVPRARRTAKAPTADA